MNLHTNDLILTPKKSKLQKYTKANTIYISNICFGNTASLANEYILRCLFSKQSANIVLQHIFESSLYCM